MPRLPPTLRFRRARQARLAARPTTFATGATETQIARIDALTATGRTNWFALLAYLAFVLVTTLGVEDVDFFVDSRQTELPLVGVSIPTFSFFIFAPILGAALYAYLHLHIRKVTEALAEPAPGTPPLEERIKPWLLNDYVLRKRRDAAIRHRPLDGLASLVTLMLVWWAGPIVLILMWGRTWPAHDLWLSALNGVCVMVALYAGVLSWQKMSADVRGDTPRARLATGLMVLLCLPVAWLTAANSKGSWEWRVAYDEDAAPEERTMAEQVEAWARRLSIAEASFRDRATVWLWDTGTALAELDPPELSGVTLSALPPEQADLSLARQTYWTALCTRYGIEVEACYRTPRVSQGLPRHISELRRKWCLARDYSIGQDSECNNEFTDLDRIFRAEWKRSRDALIASTPKPSLANADLRRAALVSSELSGIDFGRAEMSYANFSQAHMERANLSGAFMVYANFSQAILADAILSGAQLGRADFSGAQMARAVFSARWLPTGHGFSAAEMEGADFSGAFLEGADLSGVEMSRTELFRATLDGAFLNSAVVEGSLLDGAHMMGATLQDIMLNGSTLRGADLRRVRWSGEMSPAVPVHAADLRGSIGLDQNHLTLMIGDERTLLPTGVDESTQEAFFVASCWPQEPVGWTSLVAILAIRGEPNDQLRGRMTEPVLRKAFLCAPGEVPQKTGTPWPLDLPPPWETDPNWVPEDRGPVE
ncbi:MAG: pentapeptide repeat-containing protein [Pseudomonadota bacterium]